METQFEPYRQRRTSRSRKSRPWLRSLADPRGVLTITLLVVGTVIGGSIIPVSDFIIEFIAILLLALAAIRSNSADLRGSRMGWLVAGALALLALYQLFPISFGLWRSLPGREALAQIYDVTGITPAALSVSLDRSATITTLLKTLPGLAAFIAALSATAEQKSRWSRLIIGLCLAGAMQGVLQLMEVPGTFFYVETGNLFLLGPFSNHNHAADFFLIGAILAVPMVHGATSPAVKLAGLGICLLLLLTTVLTASRFGIVLGLIPLLFLAAPSLFRGKARGAMLGVALIAGLAGVYAFSTSNYNLSRNIDRFNDIAEDARPEIWKHSMAAASEYFPVGTGLGTFVPVYSRGESLDYVTASFVNHAHNDYIEIFMELGIVGLAGIFAYLAVYVFASYKSVISRDSSQCAYGLCLLVLILHSSVDYPLRNLSLMIFFGLFSGLFLSRLRKNCVDGGRC
jgi:O-antigen ligase